ncbi:MAG: ribonuclease HI family protein [Candidatus Uhrbacteria bacterium]|nr:ribonuclease HI family protein [Candidatus Uhrbacteria bacterium]
MKRARLYADGGARGNPGPAASGFVLFEIDSKGENGKRIFENGIYLGKATNNQAEYQAIVFGIKKAKELGIESLDVRLDSELAVKQLNGEYKVKNAQLAQYFLEIYNLRQTFHEIKFSHVRREFNKEADAQVNKAIDEALGL